MFGMLRERISKLAQGRQAARAIELANFSRSIDRFNVAQSNREMLDAIRVYNHSIIDALHRIRPLAGIRLLDVGASPHGYALERALAYDTAEYVGIGLDISESFELRTPKGSGRLHYMNAEALSFSDGAFDAIVSMSTFEHIADLDQCLSEFHRVLRSGGAVLISFEPIWTCSYGHHLHHLGDVARLIPDWSHLLWTREEMARHLDGCWPADAPWSALEACAWVYDGDGLNRKGIRQTKAILEASPLRIEWISPMIDAPRDPSQLGTAVARTGLTQEELMTKGLSVYLTKQ